MARRLSIDIRGRMLKFAEGKSVGESAVKIDRLAYLDIKDAVFKDERLINCSENVNMLQSFLKRHRFKTDKVILSIADTKVITRVISLPKLSLNDLNNLVNIEIPRYFPIDLSRFYIDYKVLNSFIDEDKVYYKILLCAIPSEIVKEYVDILHACNLKPLLIDVHPNSVSRLFQKIEFEDIAVIDGGVDIVDLLVLEKGGFSAYTTFPLVIPEFLELFRNRAEYDINQMEEQIEKLIQNVQNYLDFYTSTHEGKKIDKIYITGDLALIEGLQERLQEEFKIDTLIGFDDFIQVKKSQKMDINENFINANVGILLRGV